MPPISVGLIGCGEIVNSHLEAICGLPEYRIVAACDISADKRDSVTGKLGCSGFADYRALLATRPDLVVVALPHALHCPVSMEAMQTGCHVVVEKPMATSPGDCRRMLETARKCNKLLVVSDVASFTPGAALTGRKFAAGGLGRFLTGSIINVRHYFHEGRRSWFLDPEASGGGMFINVGVHRLALVRACIATLVPVSVSAAVSHVFGYAVEACTTALVKYRGGGAMIYEETGYFPKPDWLNTGSHFVFEAGIVSWDERVWRLTDRQGRESTETLTPVTPEYLPVYLNVLHSIAERSYAPQAEECAVDVAIAFAAYASARDGREVLLSEYGFGD